MKNMIVTQYQMKRAERKKWLIATLVILLAFSALIGTFCATRPGTSAKASTSTDSATVNHMILFDKGTGGKYEAFEGSSQGGEWVEKTGLMYWKFYAPRNASNFNIKYFFNTSSGQSSYTFNTKCTTVRIGDSFGLSNDIETATICLQKDSSNPKYDVYTVVAVKNDSTYPFILNDRMKITYANYDDGHMYFTESGTDGQLTMYSGSSQGVTETVITNLTWWKFAAPKGSEIKRLYYTFGQGMGTKTVTLSDNEATNIGGHPCYAETVYGYQIVPKKVTNDGDLYDTWIFYAVGQAMELQHDSSNALRVMYSGNISSTSVPLPEDPKAPEGYHFVGWYYDEAFTNPYKEGDVITADTNLYAKFEKDTYKVTYIVNGKQYVVSEVAYGDPINNTVPTGIDETNVFSGWFTDAACTQAFDFTQTASSDITLYATIKLKTYDVKFFVNGELYATVQVPHGYTLVRLANSSETGAATAAALLASFEFDENAEVNADTEITEDKEVQGKLSKKAEKWINTGAWFDKNWPWVVATAAALLVIVVGSVLVAVYKKRG